MGYKKKKNLNQYQRRNQTGKRIRTYGMNREQLEK